MRRKLIIDHQSITGNNQPPIPVTQMQRKVLKMKNATNKLLRERQSSDFSTMNIIRPQTARNQEMESNTNFWPPRERIASAVKSNSIQLSEDNKKIRPFSQKKRIRVIKGVNFRTQMQKDLRQFPNQQNQATVYKKQMTYLSSLYDKLSNVLGSITEGLEAVEVAISQYSKQILQKHLAFIDDFLVGKEEKLKKTIRTSRLYESLSIAYLFLEIAQERIDNHQSYLINFIGYCLGNLLFTARIYIIKQSQPEFQQHSFQNDIRKHQCNAFGHPLTSIQDVVLRMQHNNEIITMMHRKLGRFNPKFEQCIKAYFKYSQRKNQTCAQSTHYIFQYLAMHIHQSQLIGVSETLEIGPTPYIPASQKQYTMIIEPIGILQKEGRYRPVLTQFLEWASKYFCIVLWTWEMPTEVNQIVDFLQPYVSHKLYRHHCRIANQCYTKDLGRLGRNLDKTVIIDYDRRIFAGYQKNGIVCRWKGNFKDKGLLTLCQILEEMVTSNSNVDYTLTVYAQQLFSIRGF